MIYGATTFIIREVFALTAMHSAGLHCGQIIALSSDKQERLGFPKMMTLHCTALHMFYVRTNDRKLSTQIDFENRKWWMFFRDDNKR